MKTFLTLLTISILFVWCRPKEVIKPITPSIVITKAIDVNWTVSSPSFIDYFQLEKLDTATKTYNPLAKIQVTSDVSYSYIDKSLYDSLNTYRLKVILKDSTSFYSTIVK
jgi:hypothetical protein